jgi:hypothetical protein
MAKTRILIEFTGDRLDRVFYETRKAINTVTEQVGYNDDKLRIAMPKYFIDMLQLNLLRELDLTPLEVANSKITFFGIEVTLNYDNFIVVFHEDMPAFLENYYVVVDLK